ncbi:MAG: TetR/AcrR family transcriptional regulator [Kineosporiaceae bacterium]
MRWWSMDSGDLLDRLTGHVATRPTASMAELATAAGIGRATLFRRFPTRDALVAALAGRALDRFVTAIDEAGPEDGEPAAALARVCRAVVGLGPEVALLALQPLSPLRESALLSESAGTWERVVSLVRRGQRSGDFDVTVDPAWVVTMITWLTVGAADEVRTGRLAPRAVADALPAAVLAVLRAGTGARIVG